MIMIGPETGDSEGTDSADDESADVHDDVHHDFGNCGNDITYNADYVARQVVSND